jgi:hypothetical protein
VNPLRSGGWMSGPCTSPPLTVSLDSMGLVIGALRLLNADDVYEASLSFEEIPPGELDAVVMLLSATLEQAARWRASRKAGTER